MVLGVLGVQDRVVDALSFYALCDLPRLSNVDVHDQVLLVAFFIHNLQADSLRGLLVAENELALLRLVVFAFLCSSVLCVVGDRDLATSSRDTLQVQFEGANRLNNLNLSVVKAEDTAVVVIEDHDGGHVGSSKLDAGLHLGNAVLTSHVVVKNLKGDHLLGLSRSKGKGSNGLNVV